MKGNELVDHRRGGSFTASGARDIFWRHTARHYTWQACPARRLLWAVGAWAEELGIRAVARVLEVDPTTVSSWTARCWCDGVQSAPYLRLTADPERGKPRLYQRKDQLGYSSIQVTVDVYGHLIPGANRAAVDCLDHATSRNFTATTHEKGDRA